MESTLGRCFPELPPHEYQEPQIGCHDHRDIEDVDELVRRPTGAVQQCILQFGQRDVVTILEYEGGGLWDEADQEQDDGIEPEVEPLHQPGATVDAPMLEPEGEQDGKRYPVLQKPSGQHGHRELELGPTGDLEGENGDGDRVDGVDECANRLRRQVRDFRSST